MHSPPLDLICDPSPEFGQDGWDDVDGENKGDTGDNIEPNERKIKVYFVVIFSGYSNESFNQESQSKLVQALKNATKTLGAKQDLEITINSIEYFDTLNQRRRLSSISSASGVKVLAEANFGQQDEDVAADIVRILNDSPSTIFPVQEFGEVHVSQVNLIGNKTTSIVLPVVFGVLGGVVFCSVIAFILIKKSKKGYKRGLDEMRDASIPKGAAISHRKHMNRGNDDQPRAALIQSISSKDYSSAYNVERPDVVINNLGARFL